MGVVIKRHGKPHGKRFIVEDDTGAPLTAPLTHEEAEFQWAKLQHEERVRVANSPEARKQRQKKAAYRLAARDPYLRALKNFLPRQGEIARNTEASQARMLKLIGAQLSFASSDPQLHVELAKTPGQRRTARATHARCTASMTTMQRVLALKNQGLRQVAISKELGLSPEWVSKLLKKARFPQT